MVLADWLLNMPCLMWCRTVRYRPDLSSVITYEPRLIAFRHLFHALPAPDPATAPPGFAPWAASAPGTF